MLNRRSFVVTSGAALLGIALGAPAVAAMPAPRHRMVRIPHPTPRPGITGAKVLTAAQLASSKHLIPLFDGIRAIPQIADGIRCNCGCAEMPGFYSLLSCYEGDAMALACPICQGQGRLIVRLVKEGKSLTDIRVAVDAQFD